jgi:hypothetical protein
MEFKNCIQFAIIIIQIILLVSGIILTLLKVVDNMWPFTIAIWVLCFLCILIGVLK